ncbi:hypothetical protein [Microbacterium rhizophilus]|uniref:hypothetical protein n=1 Tax=Microbacterium rhizophilus TaxID=3138934 RepID=UPI0031E9FB3B
MNGRVLNVVRLQFVNRQTYLWVPLIILTGSLLISILIFAMIPIGTPKYGGGSQAPLWYFLAVGIQALTLSFPFSQAMSLTRREFYLGTLVAAAITGVLLSTVFVLLGLLEQATNGYGVNGFFAYLPYLWEAGPLGAWFVFFVTTMFFFVTGFWFATIYKRWSTTVLTVLMIGLGLILVGLAFLVTRLEAWPEVWTWLVTTGGVGLALWAVPLIALMALGSFLTLRRTTV